MKIPQPVQLKSLWMPIFANEDADAPAPAAGGASAAASVRQRHMFVMPRGRRPVTPMQTCDGWVCLCVVCGCAAFKRPSGQLFLHRLLKFGFTADTRMLALLRRAAAKISHDPRCCIN